MSIRNWIEYKKRNNEIIEIINLKFDGLDKNSWQIKAKLMIFKQIFGQNYFSLNGSIGSIFWIVIFIKNLSVLKMCNKI